jgi:putative chitinase
MLLKLGSTGDDVKELQEKLGLAPDGTFGQGTVEAVKQWQTANGLTADGVVGRDTWGELFALRKGSTGDDVKNLQEGLGLKVDGNFGAGTEEALKKWQAANGFNADGVFRPEMWDKLFPPAVEEEAAPVTKPDTGPATSVKDVGTLKLTKLKGCIPDAVLAQIPDCAAKFQINTPLRLAHFLAQCGHESGGFKLTEENLKYSADGLRKIFKKYFSGSDADGYARQPEKIASRVYANRMGNGNESSKDGYKYRGRGYIQLTGKNNYTAFDKVVNDDILASPDLVAKKYPLLSAAWFWDSNSLNTQADKGATDAAVTTITKRVNGGTIGLADRIKHFKEYYALLA